MSNLVVDINGVEYSEHYNYISVGYEQNILNTTVYVDNSDIINHFNISCDSKWVEIRRIRNNITFIVTKNNSINNRIATIQINHNLDNDKYVTITIGQNPCDYSISVNPSYILFDTLLDNTDTKKSEVDITVTTQNGMCDFGIGPTVQYVRNFEYNQYKPNETIFDGDIYYVKNGNEYVIGTTITTFPYTVQSNDEYYYYVINDSYREGEIIFEGQKYWYKNDNKYQILTASEDIIVPQNDNEYFRFLNDYMIAYDHGLKLTKLSNSELKITNYGKICLYDDFYYILTLYHINNPRCMAQIRVDYVDSFVNNESGFDLDDD